MNSATEHRTCPSCGTAIPANAPQGICPKCLMAAVAVATDTGQTGGKRPEPPSLERLAAAFPQLEVIEFIGQGGMGAVYKARQKQLDRIVALKVLPPGIGGDPSFAERFTREAKALAKLLHPNIVALFEFGLADGIYYLLMEYVDGVSLGQLLRSSRVSPREALAIVPQICDALQYAHDQGIVHRDIKPENILLDRRGRVKVADFGLAKLVGPEAGRAGSPLPAAASQADDGAHGVTRPTDSLTDAGKVMGTPQYMAPEQVEHPADVDHRADIYALGVVFYQMLTGELPGKPLEPPSSKVQIDVRLDEVVLRALEKKPELRYQQASVLKTQVETIASSGSAGVASPEPRVAAAHAERELKQGGIVLVGCRNGQRMIVWRGVANAFFAILGCLLIATLGVRFFIPIKVEELVIAVLLLTTLLTVGGVIMGIKTPVERLTPLDDVFPNGSAAEPSAEPARKNPTGKIITIGCIMLALLALAIAGAVLQPISWNRSRTKAAKASPASARTGASDETNAFWIDHLRLNQPLEPGSSSGFSRYGDDGFNYETTFNGNTCALTIHYRQEHSSTNRVLIEEKGGQRRSLDSIVESVRKGWRHDMVEKQMLMSRNEFDRIAAFVLQEKTAEQPAGRLGFTLVRERLVEVMASPPRSTWFDLEIGQNISPGKLDPELDDAAYAKRVKKLGADFRVVGEGNRLGLDAGNTGCLLMPVNPSNWDSLDSDKLPVLIASLTNRVMSPRMLSKKDLPATLAFQTRDGSEGLLQVIDFSGFPIGVKIRYKLVQSRRDEGK